MSDQEAQQSDPAETRPFYRLLGFLTDNVDEPGRSCLRLESRYDLQNSRGDIHGGVVASLLDAAMGVAVRSVLDEGGGATTVSLTVNYLRPGRGTLLATGHVKRSGRSLASVEAEAKDLDGNVVAHAIATMRVMAGK